MEKFVECQFGPISVVGIEWIEIPAVALYPQTPSKTFEYIQDISRVRDALLALGKQLPLEETADGLRIIGHVR